MLINVYLNPQELKELVSALEQIKSLRLVAYNNMTPVVTDECLRHLKQVAIRFHEHTQIPISEKELDERMQESRSKCKPLRSLISDQESVQKVQKPKNKRKRGKRRKPPSRTRH